MTDADRIQALEAELLAMKAMHPYVEASGHYCDGMSLAWTDSQIFMQERDRLRGLVQRLAAKLPTRGRWYLYHDSRCEGDCELCVLIAEAEDAGGAAPNPEGEKR